MNDEQKAAAAIALLTARGITASWEYPGFISVTAPNGHQLAYGNQDDAWYGHTETAEGEYVADGELPELPDNTTPEAIAEVLANVCARYRS